MLVLATIKYGNTYIFRSSSFANEVIATTIKTRKLSINFCNVEDTISDGDLIQLAFLSEENLFVYKTDYDSSNKFVIFPVNSAAPRYLPLNKNYFMNQLEYKDTNKRPETVGKFYYIKHQFGLILNLIFKYTKVNEFRFNFINAYKVNETLWINNDNKTVHTETLMHSLSYSNSLDDLIGLNTIKITSPLEKITSENVINSTWTALPNTRGKDQIISDIRATQTKLHNLVKELKKIEVNGTTSSIELLTKAGITILSANKIIIRYEDVSYKAPGDNSYVYKYIMNPMNVIIDVTKTAKYGTKFYVEGEESSSSSSHPHIDSSRQPCLGTLENPLNKAFKAKNLMLIKGNIHKFLTTYTSNDVFRSATLCDTNAYKQIVRV